MSKWSNPKSGHSGYAVRTGELVIEGMGCANFEMMVNTDQEHKGDGVACYDQKQRGCNFWTWSLP